MAYQSGKAVLVAAKQETTYNTVPGTLTAATQIRIVSGGLSLNKAFINSNEIRSDGQTALGRHGSRSVAGSYQCEMSVGSHDVLYEAAMRSTWATATSILANATSTWTLGTNTITSGGTDSFITGGVRVGDVFRLSNYSTAADNDLNLRVKTVTSSIITVLGTGVLTAGAADAACTLTLFKKLTRPATPTKRTFYVEEYFQDIDLSSAYGGVRWTGFHINGTPDGMATVEFTGLGASATAMATGTSPIYSAPVLATSLPLVFADAVISYNGVDVANATAFSLNYDLTAKTEPVVGSTISPDVFDNDARLTGSISLLRQDLTALAAFSNETILELHVMLQENEAAPKDALCFYVPALKLSGLTKALGGDGAMIETIPWSAGMKEGYTATGYNDTMLTVSTSAA